MSTPTTSTPLRDRIAGAPISWGVCEVPGWGHQLTPEHVLALLRDLGVAATEFGPDGFLPEAPIDKARTLADAGLRAVGQFVPVVLHDADSDPLPTVEEAMEGLVAAQASTVVIAAATGTEGYDERPVLDADQWETLLHNLDRISDAAATHGLLATIHPHVGTMVETCLDTGHLLIGGGDPVRVAVEHPERIGHVHLKDVRLDLAEQVQRGELTYTEGVARGMYVPLGAGDVDVAAIVRSLEGRGYTGWYVLEQDTILTGAPGDTGVDPVTDVRASVAHIIDVADRLAVTA